ncbi:WD repeat-containing protein [Colletotrichum truncatum]|uniref:WD repeat-containing protein n=1 Tax=Colletotrichum truncatum TaxID=5467 RepID=A0ACC3YD66_COLTU
MIESSWFILQTSLNHLVNHDSSVLALAVSHDSIFVGTQDGEIVVWALGTFEEKYRVQAHKRSIMCLFLSDDDSLLCSSATDPIVNVWEAHMMTRLYEIYSPHDSFGDIFSVAYSSQHDTIYFGSQNTTIQWCSLRDPQRIVRQDSSSHPDRRNHRFFDSRGVTGGSIPRSTDERYTLVPRAQTVLETDRRACTFYAHYGYVFCMILTQGATDLVEPEDDVLISGGGDGTIKVWRLGGQGIGPHGMHNGLEELMALGEDDGESVMSLAIDGSTLCSGKLDGIIEFWDLNTKQKLRVVKAHASDVTSLHIGCGYLWSASYDGTASKHNIAHHDDYGPGSLESSGHAYQPLTQFRAHEGKVLATAIASYQDHQLYITGANDNNVAVWEVKDRPLSEHRSSEQKEDEMIASLGEFMSHKTISSSQESAQDFRRGAGFLYNLFRLQGATVDMLVTDNRQHQPVVFAKFNGSLGPPEKRKRILFYGHYDVAATMADDKTDIESADPFQLRGMNGYLYGKGVSTNKGPIISALYAVKDLMETKELYSDIIFLIAGDETTGSRGFREIVQRNKAKIGHIDYILLSNGYWLDDKTPCLTYGLRGVLHATVCVSSKTYNLHSGVNGSYIATEPWTDLMLVLSNLKGPHNKILLPGFYDGILPLTRAEETRYDKITLLLSSKSRDAANLKTSLIANGQEPSLTIHDFKLSRPQNSLGRSHACAHISFELVPGQEVDEVARALKVYLEKKFHTLESDNQLSLQTDIVKEPWLGDPSSHIFQTLEGAVLDVWDSTFDHQLGVANGDDLRVLDAGNFKLNGGYTQEFYKGNGNYRKSTKPLYIRGDGSIAATRFLEKEFNAPAAHLPCGQASDGEHSGTERIRVLNLFKSREILSHVFQKL